MPTTVINSCIKILTIHMLRDIQELLVEMLQHDAAKRPDAQTIVDKVELMTSKTGKNLFYKYFQILKYFEIVNLVFMNIKLQLTLNLTNFLHFSQKITFSEQIWDSVGRRISFCLMATEKIFTLLEPECGTAASIMKIFKEFLTNVIRIGGISEEEKDLASNIEKQLMDSLKVICW